MKTVLFDLDGTLLPMDQELFLKAYFSGLARALAPCGYEPKTLIAGVWGGCEAMSKNDGKATNEEVFWNSFSGQVRADARDQEPVFQEYYRGDFQQVRKACGFAPQAAEVVRFLKERGCRLVMATNPLFPRVATESRIRWAGLDPADFELITTYENSCHCKPNPEYYRDILETLKESPENCLMVGNDAQEDTAAEKVGIRVFLLTPCLLNRTGADISAYPQGGFPELMEFLRANAD